MARRVPSTLQHLTRQRLLPRHDCARSRHEHRTLVRYSGFAERLASSGCARAHERLALSTERTRSSGSPRSSSSITSGTVLFCATQNTFPGSARHPIIGTSTPVPHGRRALESDVESFGYGVLSAGGQTHPGQPLTKQVDLPRCDVQGEAGGALSGDDLVGDRDHGSPTGGVDSCRPGCGRALQEGGELADSRWPSRTRSGTSAGRARA